MATARLLSADSSLPADLSGTKLGRFVVRHKLGAGGMGEVYFAEDTTLHRPVALKRISHEFHTYAEVRQRILAEAQRASALSSEHIASVYDVFEDLDEVFLVMEYVDGTTLSRRLQSMGRLGLESFLDIAVQCGEALAEAQRKGIVHRDIKPSNIMLTGSGCVKVLDFGLARHLPTADANALTASFETQTVGCAGTPGYMAPEVLLQRQLDSRADIFSLGVVFYEMLTGRHPFEGSTFVATADHILHLQPQAIATLVDGVPAEVERIVFKMLAKSSDERYATAADLLVDLRAISRLAGAAVQFPSRSPGKGWKPKIHFAEGTVVLALLLLLGSGLWHRWKPWHGPPELPGKKYLAVLPFEAASNNADAQAFARGLTEALTARLSQLSDRYPLQVVSPREPPEVTMASVGQARTEFGANLVLEGNIRQSGSQVRVVYQLVDAQDQRVLRADTITADASDPFALEDRVVGSGIRSLNLELDQQEKAALASRGTSQPMAYDFYLRGRGYLQEYQKPESIESAIAVFQHALERDPNFALAYAGLGEGYWRKYELTHQPDWVARALETCQRAAGTREGRTCLGIVYNGTGKYEEASAEFQRALEADKTDQNAYRGLASAYEHLGKMVEAELAYRDAIKVRPEYWGGYNWLGAFLFQRARYDEAAQMFTEVVHLAPDNVRGYSNLCGTYIMAGRYAEALPACQHSVNITPTQDAYLNLGTTYFYQHRFPEAAHAYEQAIKLDDHQSSCWANLGDAYYWDAGQRQEAAAAYKKAIGLAEDALRVNPRDAIGLSYLALYHAMLSEKEPAWTYLRRALALDSHTPEIRLNAALVANQLGDEKRAIFSLRAALESGLSPNLIRNHPGFDNLRPAKPFQQLLQENRPAAPDKQPQ